MRVALITTGKTELRGLPRALSALFPGHTFHAIEDIPGRPFRGFTSAALPPPPDATRIPTTLDQIVRRVVALVDPVAPELWDHVLIIDDLELCNRHQPAVVVETVRKAFARHLSPLLPSLCRATELVHALRHKASLHLVKPMIESWFFGAPRALTTAGVTHEHAYHVRGGDPEDFESTDRAYIAATDASCPVWCRHRRKKGDRPKWLGAGADRIHHPKGYLQWLMIDEGAETCTTYDEAGAGAEALAAIEWAALFAQPGNAPFARSLVEDLADRLGAPPELERWQGECAAETSISHLPWWPILRNI